MTMLAMLLLCTVCQVTNDSEESCLPSLAVAKELVSKFGSGAANPKTIIKQSRRIALYSVSRPPNIILVAEDKRLASLTKSEFAACIAREIGHLRTYVVRRQRAVSSAEQLSLVNGPGFTMGPWSIETRQAALRFAADIVKSNRISQIALLTLLENERYRLGIVGNDVFDGWTGGSMDVLIDGVRTELKRQAMPIRRSLVSRLFRVRSIEERQSVAFYILGRELFTMSPAEYSTHPDAGTRLNALFDQLPTIFTVHAEGRILLCDSKPIVSFGEPNGEQRAREAADAIRKAIYDYDMITRP